MSPRRKTQCASPQPPGSTCEPLRQSAQGDQKHCPVCGAPITPQAQHCRRHAPRTAGPGIRHQVEATYTSSLYVGRLTEACHVLGPAHLCRDWGTPHCRDCTIEFPPACPILSGTARAWCGKCRVPCRCNGTE
jgi:hypothetical protein